jgi:hypothetical protein
MHAFNYPLPVIWYMEDDANSQERESVEQVIYFDVDGDEFPATTFMRRQNFFMACLNFEQLHGERAVNDFRAVSVRKPEVAGPADICRDAARAGSLGGKECSESIQPCRAPSEDNTRIGAIPL